MKRFLEISSLRDGIRIGVAFTIVAVVGTLAFGEVISWLIAYPINWKQYVLRGLIPLFVAPAVVVPLIVMNLRLNRLRTEMLALARTDTLTGLPNRRAFFARANEIFALLQGHEPAAVLMIDIDRFKSINDTFGHDTGDAVLKTIAQTIVAVASERGAARALAARIGGEEFAVVVDGFDAAEAAALAEAICMRVREAVTPQGNASIRATVSVGVALRQGTALIDEVLKAADTAVYDAKEQGRDRWCMVRATVSPAKSAAHNFRAPPRAA